MVYEESSKNMPKRPAQKFSAVAITRDRLCSLKVITELILAQTRVIPECIEPPPALHGPRIYVRVAADISPTASAAVALDFVALQVPNLLPGGHRRVNGDSRRLELLKIIPVAGQSSSWATRIERD